MNPDFGFLVGCSPACNFGFTRAYVKRLAFTGAGWPHTWDGKTFTLFVGSPLIYTEVVIFRDPFLAWSSNCYTLDYIVEQIYYYTPGAPPSPGGCGVNWFPNSNPPTLPSIQIDLIATGTPNIFVNLPPAPDDYWAK